MGVSAVRLSEEASFFFPFFFFLFSGNYFTKMKKFQQLKKKKQKRSGAPLLGLAKSICYTLQSGQKNAARFFFCTV